MPRQRRVPRARVGGITPAQKRWFLNPFAALDEGPFASDEERRAIWEAHRDAWLAEYAVTHPGERPPAWWRYDAPEERNIEEPERTQLRRLGVLSAAETQT